MSIMPATDLIEQNVNAYGNTWKEHFSNLIQTPACAKHMSELIEDIDIFGQQTDVLIKDGMIVDGHKVVLALALMDQDVSFIDLADSPVPQDTFWMVEFEVEGGMNKKTFDHLADYLSFRVNEYWVYPDWIDPADREDITVIFNCPGGSSTADLLPYMAAERLRKLAGLDDATGFCVVGEVEVVDDEA